MDRRGISQKERWKKGSELKRGGGDKERSKEVREGGNTRR